MAVDGVAPVGEGQPVIVALAQQLGPDAIEVCLQEPAGDLAQWRQPENTYLLDHGGIEVTDTVRQQKHIFHPLHLNGARCFVHAGSATAAGRTLSARRHYAVSLLARWAGRSPNSMPISTVCLAHLAFWDCFKCVTRSRKLPPSESCSCGIFAAVCAITSASAVRPSLTNKFTCRNTVCSEYGHSAHA